MKNPFRTSKRLATETSATAATASTSNSESRPTQKQKVLSRLEELEAQLKELRNDYAFYNQLVKAANGGEELTKAWEKLTPDERNIEYHGEVLNYKKILLQREAFNETKLDKVEAKIKELEAEIEKEKSQGPPPLDINDDQIVLKLNSLSLREEFLFKFIERESLTDFVSKIVGSVSSCVKKKASKHSQDFHATVIRGASGVGKTRFADHLFDVMVQRLQDFRFFYMKFKANIVGYEKLPDESNQVFLERLIVRDTFFGQSVRAAYSLKQVMEKFRKVIFPEKQEKPFVVFLHIDEFQKNMDFTNTIVRACREYYESGSDGTGIFYPVLSGISSMKIEASSTPVTVSDGASNFEVQLSGFTNEDELEQMYGELANQLKLDPKLEFSNFRTLVDEFGGMPRAYEFLAEAVTDMQFVEVIRLGLTPELAKVLINAVISKFESFYDESTLIDQLRKGSISGVTATTWEARMIRRFQTAKMTAIRLVTFSIANARVRKEYSIAPGCKTFDQAEQSGLVSLKYLDAGKDIGFLQIPRIMIARLVKFIGSYEDAVCVGLIPTLDELSPFNHTKWQTLEMDARWIFQCRINSFHYLGMPKTTFEDFFYGMYFHPILNNTEVQIPDKDVVTWYLAELLENCDYANICSGSDGKGPKVNIKSTEFCSFLPMTDQPAIDYCFRLGSCLFVVQMKHTGAPSETSGGDVVHTVIQYHEVRSILERCQKLANLMKSKMEGVTHTYLILFTNRKMSPELKKESIIEEYKNALLIFGDNFIEAAGIFGRRRNMVGDRKTKASLFPIA